MTPRRNQVVIGTRVGNVFGFFLGLGAVWAVTVCCQIARAGQTEQITLNGLPGGWEQLDLEPFVALAQQVTESDLSGGQGDDALKQLALVAEKKFLSKAEDLKGSSQLPKSWRLAGLLAKHLTRERREYLSKAYLKRIADHTDALKTFHPDQFVTLIGIFDNLGTSRSDTNQLIVLWMRIGSAWRSSNAIQLRKLLLPHLFNAKSEHTIAARSMLIEEVLSRFSSATGQTAVDRYDLFELSAYVMIVCTQQQRIFVSDYLRTTYINDPARLGSLSLDELLGLKYIYQVLRVKGLGEEAFKTRKLYARWCEAGEQWKNLELTPLAILMLQLQMEKSPEQTVQPVVDHIWDTYYRDQNQWAKYLTEDDFLDMLGIMAPHLAMARKEQVDKLLVSLDRVQPEHIKTLSANEAQQFCTKLKRLGASPKLVESVVMQWSTSRQDVASYQTKELVAMMGLLGSPHGLVAKEKGSHIAEEIATRLLTAPNPGQEISDANILKTIVPHLSQATLTDLQKVFAQWINTPKAWEDSTTPSNIQQQVQKKLAVLTMLGMAEDQRNQLGSELMVRAYNSIDIWYPYRLEPYMNYGKPHRYWYGNVTPYLGPARNADLPFITNLRKGLADGTLEPRPSTVFILCWYYRDRWYYHGQTTAADDWKAYLDQRIDSYLPGTEKRLQWLLARGYAEELTDYEPSPQRGRKWIDQAYAEATSDEVRLHLVQAMFIQAMGVSKYAEAESLLRGLEKQFTSEQAKATFARMREMIVKHKEADVVIVANERKKIESDRLKGSLASLERRLEQFKEKGRSQADIDSIQRLIEQTQTRLDAQ